VNHMQLRVLRPEAMIQKAIINSLRIKCWHVMPTTGNALQAGFPDLYACHYRYGSRWIEVKRPWMRGSYFTDAQFKVFPEMIKHGAGIWVMTDSSEYECLFRRHNLVGAMLMHEPHTRKGKTLYESISDGPEGIIQQDICAFLRVRGWFVKVTVGNMYQSGFPDLFACHPSYGIRWIEVKNPEGYRFTGAQLENFPKMCANGTGIWIMTEASENQYNWLSKKYNWEQYKK